MLYTEAQETYDESKHKDKRINKHHENIKTVTIVCLWPNKMWHLFTRCGIINVSVNAPKHPPWLKTHLLGKRNQFHAPNRKQCEQRTGCPLQVPSPQRELRLGFHSWLLRGTELGLCWAPSLWKSRGEQKAGGRRKKRHFFFQVWGKKASRRYILFSLPLPPFH